MGDSRNRVGTSYALTVFTPIVAGREDELRAHLEGLPQGAGSALARVEQLHTARMQIFDHLVHQGARQKPDRLKSNYLVFTANFDGDRDDFLDAICARLAPEADALWGHCAGYPGASNRAAFKRYIAEHQIHTNLSAAAYATASVSRVRESLALRDRVVDFAADAQGLDAAALKERFLNTFAEAQR